MNQEIKQFLASLSWSFLGGLIASFLMMFINILAGRFIGPEGYGKYNLILTLSQIFMIPIFFGLDIASMRAIARSRNKKEQAGNISSAFYFISATLLIFSFLFLVSHKLVAQKFSIETAFLATALVFTIFVVLKSILDSFIKGLCLFKNQFWARIVEVSFITLSFLFVFFVLKRNDYISYIVILIIGYSAVVLFYLKRLWPFLFQFDSKLLKKQLSYGKFILLSAVLGTAFISLDKLIIVKYLSIAQLGIYGAYFMASTGLIAQVVQMFTNVFFPVISKSSNESFIKKIDKLFYLFFVPGFLGMGLVIYIIMRLFGEEYGVNWNYVASFALLSVLQIYLTINTTTITAISKKLFKKYILYFNILNGVHFVAYGILIYLGRVSIQSIVLLLILNVSISILIQRKLIASFLLSTGEKKLI